ncbi:hypothetical protein TUM19329_00800 [Legionella antarctica]|uniref:Uncharacterized protein n=1 Tax=Legionella antarctica TaxID=2708020 RepID=A0A6F8SZV1_9GAMM|nr:hypothetical protein [Legionella antarctica]BCA93719.1 hypothetical protein TUM19329_00800 [Legionella antarctica]
MSTKDVYDELKTIMTDALLQMSRLSESGVTRNADFLATTQLFLISIISTVAEIAETVSEGGATWVYAEIETAAKHGGIDTIRKTTTSKNQYSIADMAPDDFPSAMNYIGQELSATLFKSMHELPQPLRKPEMLLRGVEALLGNLLNQKFSDNSHGILDSLCEHVHMALDDLQSGKNTGKKPVMLRVVKDE